MTVVPAKFARLLDRLVAVKRGTRDAVEVKTTLERSLMKVIQADGLRGADRLIAALKARGHHFATVEEKRAGIRRWREDFTDPPGFLDITAVSNRTYRSTLISYHATRPVRLTARQRAIHALQEVFYARYMAVGQKAYRDPRSRLTPDDRLLLLVGELEADVNNGGFSQYLANKGRRRARAAVAALQAIGARKTAAMLEKAMAPGTTEAQLSALDGRFCAVPEDLAVLSARHVGLGA